MVVKESKKTEGEKLETKEKEKTENGGEELVEERQEGRQVKEKGDPKTLTEKMLDLMERLAEYGFLTMAEIHFIFGNKTWAYGVMNELRRQGIVADFDTHMSPRKGHYLTHKGYRVLGKFHRLKVGLRFNLDRYSTFIFRHRLACAKVGITLAKHPSVREFMPESRLWKRRKKATDKLCDGEFLYKVADHSTVERVGLEVELTLKNQGKLDESMEQLGRRKDLDQVWWLCGDSTTLKAVQREARRRDYWLAPQRHFFILLDDFLSAKGGKADLTDPEGRPFSIDADAPTLLPRQPEPEPEPEAPPQPATFYPVRQPRVEAVPEPAPAPIPPPEPSPMMRGLARLGSLAARFLKWTWNWLRESWSVYECQDGRRILTFERWPQVCAAAVFALTFVVYRHGPAMLKIVEPIANPPASSPTWRKRVLSGYGIPNSGWWLQPLALSSADGRYRFKARLMNEHSPESGLCGAAIFDTANRMLASRSLTRVEIARGSRLDPDLSFDFRAPRSMDRFLVILLDGPYSCGKTWQRESFLVQFH
jgi:hypothetical protein